MIVSRMSDDADFEKEFCFLPTLDELQNILTGDVKRKQYFL